MLGLLQGFSLEDPCKKTLRAEGQTAKDTFFIFRSDSDLCFNKINFCTSQTLTINPKLTLNRPGAGGSATGYNEGQGRAIQGANATSSNFRAKNGHNKEINYIYLLMQ